MCLILNPSVILIRDGPVCHYLCWWAVPICNRSLMRNAQRHWNVVFITRKLDLQPSQTINWQFFILTAAVGLSAMSNYAVLAPSGSCADTSISTRISSSAKRVTPTQVHSGWWSGIYFRKLRTIAARASLFIGTWYELTRKTWDQPFPPASLRARSTFAKARSIWELISFS